MQCCTYLTSRYITPVNRMSQYSLVHRHAIASPYKPIVSLPWTVDKSKTVVSLSVAPQRDAAGAQLYAFVSACHSTGSGRNPASFPDAVVTDPIVTDPVDGGRDCDSSPERLRQLQTDRDSSTTRVEELPQPATSRDLRPGNDHMRRCSGRRTTTERRINYVGGRRRTVRGWGKQRRVGNLSAS